LKDIPFFSPKLPVGFFTQKAKRVYFYTKKSRQTLITRKFPSDIFQ